ncbi:MAG: acyl-CoA dehydrogenase [Alphaproteobacteria bacterium]|nr:acyl-CoA dehydrogenase [Alphaproteobacteria bacterium]
MTLPDSATRAVGRIVAAADVVTAAPVAAMMAMFARTGRAPASGDPLPPLWHGLFCTTKLPPERLGEDGLPRDETLLPAIEGFPAKLFAGARFSFRAPILIGDAITRESEVTGFEPKEGKSGRMILARVEHRVIGPRGLAVVEENDIVYRPGGGGPAAAASPAAPESVPVAPPRWSRVVVPDPVLMFRHSALTFNSHRIHYDRDYVRGHGMPGLLVQAMLIARLMLELVHAERPSAQVAAFSFRAGLPLYDTAPFRLTGEPASDGRSAVLAATASDGARAMAATVAFAADEG